jgi:predicted PurR-regulated permease PerM
MARIVSLVVLIVILLAVGGLFLQVMAGFLLPLFLALLLVVIFGPLHDWFQKKCAGHDRIAALLTTGSILLLVLIPLLLLGVEAAYDAQSVYRDVTKSESSKGSRPAHDPSHQASAADLTALVHWSTEKAVDLGGYLGMDLNRKDLEASVGDRVRQFLAPLALRTTQFLGETLVSLFVMVLATYYFFADGPAMVQSLLRLSPIQGGRTQELIDQFDSVTRAVVMATLLSAFAQGLLAGAGYYVAGVGSVFLLTALTMLFTLVPFVGAAIIWVPVCLWLFAVEGRTLAAVFLAIYCIAVLSIVDNLVKPMVLRGRSNLHPLLALLSVLGGVKVLGAVGILVGPMVVAFLQTLLEMVHTEINSMARHSPEPVVAAPKDTPL